MENIDKNKAIAYLLKSKGALPESVDVDSLVEIYCQSCSLACDAETLSIVAATLANGGKCPLTGERVFEIETV
jgi:glutaminase